VGNQKREHKEAKTQIRSYQTISIAWLKRKKFILEIRLILP
jgi:hypothetical protein